MYPKSFDYEYKSDDLPAYTCVDSNLKVYHP